MGRKRARTQRSNKECGSPQLHVAGLFAGIGGLELGLRRAGHKVAFLCEIDSACQTVLRKRFPGVKVESDIRKIERLPRDIQLIAAGFPCQDLSQAGKTEGITGSRSRLIDKVFGLLRKNPVEWVLLENVPFMLQLNNGHALSHVVTCLERLGYKWAYRVIDTQAFGIPQRRERVFLLASRNHDPRGVLLGTDSGKPSRATASVGLACGFYWTEGNTGLGWAVDSIPTLKGGSQWGIPSPPAILMPDGNVTKPHIRDAERLQGFRAGWTAPVEMADHRSRPATKPTKGATGSRWRLVGNAVTPQIVQWIGERIAKGVEFKSANAAKPLRRGGKWPRAAFNVSGRRHGIELSTWPVTRKHPPLAEFLKNDGTLLSERATAGFVSRIERSSLKLPVRFLDRLRAHLKRVRNELTPERELLEKQTIAGR